MSDSVKTESINISLLEKVFPEDQFIIENGNNNVVTIITKENNQNCAKIKMYRSGTNLQLDIDRLDRCGISGSETLEKIEKFASMAGIDEINLFDDSHITICGKEFSLAVLKILTKGETWYNSKNYSSLESHTKNNKNKKVIKKTLRKIFSDPDLTSQEKDLKSSIITLLKRDDLTEEDLEKHSLQSISNMILNLAKDCENEEARRVLGELIDFVMEYGIINYAHVLEKRVGSKYPKWVTNSSLFPGKYTLISGEEKYFGRQKTAFSVKEGSDGIFKKPPNTDLANLLIVRPEEHKKKVFREMQMYSEFKKIVPKIYFIKVENYQEPITLSTYIELYEDEDVEFYLTEKITCYNDLETKIKNEIGWQSFFSKLDEIVQYFAKKRLLYSDIKIENLCIDTMGKLKMIDLDKNFVIHVPKYISEKDCMIYVKYQVYISAVHTGAIDINQRSDILSQIGKHEEINEVLGKQFFRNAQTSPSLGSETSSSASSLPTIFSERQKRKNLEPSDDFGESRKVQGGFKRKSRKKLKHKKRKTGKRRV